MGYYYNDPSGLGSWYVPDNTTPAAAIGDIVEETGITLSPVLTLSVVQNPDAHVVGGGKPVIPFTPLKPDSKPAIHPKIISTVPIGGAACPSGYTYDVINQVCVNTDDTGPIVCEPGWFYDAYNDRCVQIDTTPTGGGPPTGSTSSGATNVTITVNNAVSLADGVGQAIAQATKEAIAAAVSDANNVAESAGNAVTNAIKSTVDKIAVGANNLLDGLKSALSYIGGLIKDNVGALISFITNNIGTVVNAVANAVTTIKDIIVDTVVPVIQKVNDVITNTIQPIFQAISQTYNQTVALISEIKNDVSNGIQGLMQLPGDISNAIVGIEATINRTIDQIGINKKGSAETKLSYPDKDSIWNRLEHIGRGVANISGVDNAHITFSDIVRLSEPDLARAGAANVNALVGEITDFVRTLMAGRTSVADLAKTALPLSLPLLGAEVGTWVGIWELFHAIEELFEPFYEFARDEIKAKSGLAKLPVGQVLEAWRRGIINDEDLKEDIAVNGWDLTRIQVLKDLKDYLVDIGTSIDMWHRKIITESELDISLTHHGASKDQIVALKAQSIKLYNPQLAITARRWGLINDEDLHAILLENRYSENEASYVKATLYERQSVENVFSRGRLTTLYTGLGFSPPGFENVPTSLRDAVARSGKDAEVATDLWQASFYVHSLNEWIELYFRGVRTKRELDAALDYYRVPEQFRDDLIRARRSLIPFRTIPTMLANGIISEPYAKSQLEAHGFDSIAVEALLRYAQIGHGKQKVAASGDLFGLSVATAKGYFDAGTITAEQYKEVLLTHGYDEQSATFTVSIETAHAEMLARKQLASDIVAEVKSGIMSIEQASNMMDANNFSQAEKARVLNNVNRMKRSAAKVPSEGELHSMVEHDAINVDNYRAGMIANGWEEPWLTAFITWRFPSATLIASAT